MLKSPQSLIFNHPRAINVLEKVIPLFFSPSVPSVLNRALIVPFTIMSISQSAVFALRMRWYRYVHSMLIPDEIILIKSVILLCRDFLSLSCRNFLPNTNYSRFLAQ